MVSETIYVPTHDGWSLALHRHLPEKRTRQHPILMLHGLGANRLHFDLSPRLSLARAALARGFEVFVAEFRGAGMSRPPNGAERHQFEWGFGDYCQRDLPQLLSAVLNKTGATTLHGVGHSMGGMVLCAHAVGDSSSLKSLTAVGSPCIGELHLGPREKHLLRLGARITPGRGQYHVPMRLLLGTAGRLLRPFSRHVGDGILLNPANVDPEVLAIMATEAIDDVPLRLIREITESYVADEAWAVRFLHEGHMHRIATPTMLISGSVDRIATPSSVKALLRRLHADDVRYRTMGSAHGDRADYGHVDLLVGRHAPEEVYPLVLDFVEEIDGG